MPLTNMNHVQSVFILGLACVCIKNLNVWESADAPACFLLEMRAFMQRKQQQIHLNGRLSPPAYGR